MKKDPLIGQKLANYRVDKPLGRGGMAQVYFGIDSQLERPVAIKVIDARYQGDPEYARRFVDEAKLVARWRHENIIQVYYAGVENEIYFFAMEYIDGSSLEALMERYLLNGELMPHEEVLKIGAAVASALDYAHKQGVVHRDIKPSNIMISRDERVVLMDFGLALDMGQGSMGQVFGTPHYISPEQARKSSDATAQSDIYSFGVVLYEMLTGKIPFDDESATSVAVQHITKEPPAPTLLNPALNQAIENVLLQALAKAPEARFQSATAMLEALRAAMGSADARAAQIMPPLATTGRQVRISRMSISDMLALDLDADEKETAESMRRADPKYKQATQEAQILEDEKATAESLRAINPVHYLETQEAAVPAPKTQVAMPSARSGMGQETLVHDSPETGTNRNMGLIVGLGSALIVVLAVILGLLIMNMGGNQVDGAGTETQVAALAATGGADIFETETLAPTVDDGGTATRLAETAIINDAPPTVMATATDDTISTATSIALTNDAVLLANTDVAATNHAAETSIAQTATSAAENAALASTNVALEMTLTAQAIPTQAPAEPTVLFPDGLLLEMTYNTGGFYLRNSSDTNIRLSTLSFTALDASGNSVGNRFDAVDWTRFYSNVDREGRCVVIELLDQSAWTRPNNCVAAGGGNAYNAQLTFPTNDQRIFWDGRNNATQFAVSQNGGEVGRCRVVDGYCALRIGR